MERTTNREISAWRCALRVTNASLPGCLLVTAAALIALVPPQDAHARLSQASAPSPKGGATRFDVIVREEMFSGMAGDRDALVGALKLCEQELEKNPKNPEAMVWHGAGLVFQAGQMFRTGDFANGKMQMVRGLQEMDDAVALSPENIAVLIPRGASLLGYAAHSSDAQRSRPRLEMGLADYEKVLAIQTTDWEKLPAHSRGELLSALAAGWLQAGNAEKARSYAQKIARELPGSRYAARAQDFLASSPPAERLDWPCLGCHLSAAR